MNIPLDQPDDLDLIDLLVPDAVLQDVEDALVAAAEVLDNADALVPVFNGLRRRFANQGLPDFTQHTTRSGSSFSP